MQLRAVLFDLWETLIHDTPDRAQPRRAWRGERVRKVLAAHAIEVEIDSVHAALDATGMALNSLHDSGRDVHSEGRASLFSSHLEAATGKAVPAEAIPDLETVITDMPLDMAPTLAPGALASLSALKDIGLATALVCNAGFTTAPHLRNLLEAYGLLRQLDVLVFSDELQIAKPHPGMFRAALDGLRLPASDCVFIGDNPHTDIGGAQASGLFAIQIGAKERDGITPDALIRRLDELIPALRLHQLLLT